MRTHPFRAVPSGPSRARALFRHPCCHNPSLSRIRVPVVRYAAQEERRHAVCRHAYKTVDGAGWRGTLRIPRMAGRHARGRRFHASFVKARLYAAPQLHELTRRHQVHTVAAFVDVWLAGRCCAASGLLLGIPRALEVFHVSYVPHARGRAGVASGARASACAVGLRVRVGRWLEPRILAPGFATVLRRTATVVGRQRRRHTTSIRS